MTEIEFALLRGVCQLPAYVAFECGYLRDEGIKASLRIAPTAWTVPEQLARGEVAFAVIPWTRVAADSNADNTLVLVCGSGVEEAALVVRSGMEPYEVRRVALPQEGGMKDLTALALLEEMGWRNVEVLRMPSGDAAILSFVGEAVDAASMVEPYASMLEHLGLGRVVRRTGDVWPKAPGCSLTTTARVLQERGDLVDRMVRAYLRGAELVENNPKEAARIGAQFIGVSAEIVARALESNRPDPQCLRNEAAMSRVLDKMLACGYLRERPHGYLDLDALDRASAVRVASGR